MLPSVLATAYGHVLPYLEIVLGAFLILGLFLKFSSAVSGLVVLSWAIAKIQAMIRGLDIDSCGCLGSNLHLLVEQSLVIDVVLLLLAAQIFFHHGEFLTLGPWLSRFLKRSK